MAALLLLPGCVASDPSITEAYVACQDFVRDRLAAPATAEFPFGSDRFTVQTGNRFRVRSYVDAENRFSAFVRVNYDCIVEYTADSAWRLISLELEE